MVIRWLTGRAPLERNANSTSDDAALQEPRQPAAAILAAWRAAGSRSPGFRTDMQRHEALLIALPTLRIEHSRRMLIGTRSVLDVLTTAC